MNIKPLLAYSFIRVLSFTYRYKWINPEALEDIKRNSPTGNYLFGLWHQNLIGAILSQLGHPHAVVVSSSQDGALVAKTCELMGHEIALGSSTRGGQSALKKMISFLKKGTPGAITVDGPKGPAREAKKGIFELAFLTKIPVVPFIIYPKSYWTFKKSWDQFRLPKPFTTFYLMYGAPLYMDKSSKEDNFFQVSLGLKQQLEQGEEYIKSILSSDLPISKNKTS